MVKILSKVPKKTGIQLLPIPYCPTAEKGIMAATKLMFYDPSKAASSSASHAVQPPRRPAYYPSHGIDIIYRMKAFDYQVIIRERGIEGGIGFYIQTGMCLGDVIDRLYQDHSQPKPEGYKPSSDTGFNIPLGVNDLRIIYSYNCWHQTQYSSRGDCPDLQKLCELMEGKRLWTRIRYQNGMVGGVDKSQRFSIILSRMPKPSISLTR